MAQLRWGATTDPGRVRSENEDTFVTEPMVFAVADGMGGHQAGEVASALAASIMRDRLGAGASSEDAAAAAVGEANAAIYGAAKANPAQSGMGTTLTAIAVLVEEGAEGEPGEERLVLLNVGDSRTYRFRNGRLQRVTVDHSYVQELVAAGHISMEEARTHPRRNIVTRALGIEPVVRADMWTLPIVRGDRFILASDGLVDEVPDNEILDLVASIEDPQELSKELVDIANRNGGHDNVTVVVLDVLEGAEPPDPTDELQFDPAWAEDVTEPESWADVGLAPPPLAATAPLAAAGAAVSAESVDGVMPEMMSAETMPEGVFTPPAPVAVPMPPPPILSSPPPPPPEMDDQPDPDEATATWPSDQLPQSVDSEAAVDPMTEPPIEPAMVAAAQMVDPSATTDPPNLPPSEGGVNTPIVAAAGGVNIAESAKTAVDQVKPKRRRFTAGVFLFVIVIATIVIGTFTFIAIHARSGYFVGFEGDTVVVYKGQRDNVLWFEPTVNLRSETTRDQLTDEVIAAVEAQPTFDSADDAAVFIQIQVTPNTTPSAEPPTTTKPSPPTTASNTVVETTTTAESGP